MTDADLVTKKLAYIETCVRELRELAHPELIFRTSPAPNGKRLRWRPRCRDTSLGKSGSVTEPQKLHPTWACRRRREVLPACHASITEVRQQ